MSLWNGRRVPFTLLGGYLGAGKTTILNHVLRHVNGRRIVVLVNDVAALNVDAALIADHDGTTLSLTNGCVCCAIADDFAQTLEQVRSLPERPDHVVMELSGVGEPARVAPWAGTAGFRLDGVVVAADADQIVELSSRQYVSDTIREQLAGSDLVLLTKTDLAADRGDAARALIKGCTGAPIVEVCDGAIDSEIVLGIERGDMALPQASLAPGDYDTTIVEIGARSLSELEQLLVGLPERVIRAKGLVRCIDEEVPVEAHVVGTRRMVRKRPDLDMARATNQLVMIQLFTGGVGRSR